MSTGVGRRRGARVPWLWVRIVRASGELTALQKLIFDEQRGLTAGGRGATAGAGKVGLRLGVSRESVEVARRELLEFGLLHKLDLGQGRSASWTVTLPQCAHPPVHCLKLCDDDVQGLGKKLDEHVRAKRAQRGVDGNATQGLKVVS